ncbi:MAG: phosphoribosylamine--glycine ligase [Lentisphaeraceae bacterium]|nr:phosphoribosylamine--glycine ligase [Lentisphaeraceae bacterium]
MKVLVVGGGGREHAIAWRFNKDENVSKVYAAPGNPGMKNVECIDITDFEELANFAAQNDIGLTMVGPEVPLCEGIVDVFKAKGLKIFGPDKAAAQLEGSKSFCKDFMVKYDIPTAESATFTNEAEALAYIEEKGAPIVVKADGLAAGKGVIVAETKEQALEGVKSCFEGSFGDAGYKVVIEEFLDGEEASIFAFLDGTSSATLASSQDHKRAYDGDLGPNTGGMGSYSPAPVVTDAVMEMVQKEVLDNVTRGLQEEGLYYRGIIFVGLMIKNGVPKVLEFNVRFGDPETQTVLMRLDSSLSEAMLATVEGRLDGVDFKWSDDPACCVVLASGGYPGKYAKGHTITGFDEAEENGAVVFHAGTSLVDGNIVNTGGRVLGVTARGKDIKEAVDKAYEAVGKIKWQDVMYRKDIAYRAIERLNK